jgi:hypothetical protein
MKAYKPFLLLVIGSTGAAWAEFPVQARLLAQISKVNPEQVNTELSGQGLKEYKYYSALGVEMTYPVIRFFDFGLRYVHRQVTNDEDPSTAATAYSATLTQDAILLIGRVPVLRSGLLKLDLFAGAGGTNTTFEESTAALSGKLTRKASSSDWLAAPYVAYGASVGVGYKKFYLFAEGGFERNNISRLKSSGTMSGNISEINLNGPYVMVGLLFDGVSAHQK